MIVYRVQVAYSTDLEQAREVLLEVAARNHKAAGVQHPTRTVDLDLPGHQQAGRAVADRPGDLEGCPAVRKQGLVIPFPQVDPR